MRLQAYRHLVRSSFQEHLEFRLNLGLEVVGSVLTTLVLVWLWRAAAHGAMFGGFTFPELMTYIIGCGLITGFLNIAGQGDSINDEINHGVLSGHLVKPIDPFFVWFIRDMTRKAVSFLIAAVGFIVIGGWYRAFLLPPASVWALTGFLTFVLLASVLHFLLYGVFALMAFWVEQTWGERFVVRVASELFSGSLIPLSLFPGALSAAANVLPFRFFAYVPMSVYLGRFNPQTVAVELFVVALWIIALAAVARVMLARGLRRYVGEGI